MSGINGTDSSIAQLISEIPEEEKPARAQLRIAVLVLIVVNISCAFFMIVRTLFYTRKDRRRIGSFTYNGDLTWPRPVFCKCWWYWLARQRPFETDDVFPVSLSFGTIVQGIMLLWVVVRALDGGAPTDCNYASEVAWAAIWITPFITLVFLMECMIRAISTPRLKPRGRYAVPVCFAVVFVLLIVVWAPTRTMQTSEDEFCNGQLMSYLNQFSSGGIGLISIMLPVMGFLIMLICMHLFKDPEVSEKERTSASKTVYYSLCTIIQWVFIVPFFATSSATSFPAVPVFIASVFLNVSGIWVSTVSLYIRANLAKVTIKVRSRYSTHHTDSQPPPLPEKDRPYIPTPPPAQVERVQPNLFPYNLTTANESTIRITIDPTPQTPRRPVPTPIETNRLVRYNGAFTNTTGSVSNDSPVDDDPIEVPMSGRTLVATTSYPDKSQMLSPVSVMTQVSVEPSPFSFVDTPRHFFGPVSPVGLPSSPSSLRTARSAASAPGPSARPPLPPRQIYAPQYSHNRTDSASTVGSTNSQTGLLVPRVILPRSSTTGGATAQTARRVYGTHVRNISAPETSERPQERRVVLPIISPVIPPQRRDSGDSRTLGSELVREEGRSPRTPSVMTTMTTMTTGTLPIMFDRGNEDLERGLGRQERFSEERGGYLSPEQRIELEREESFKEVRRWTRDHENDGLGGNQGGWF
ncbi:hypothetical protein BJ508DRAFT_314358 [Ascobolus immersus RN42]|uniref:Uncharacterized protein n=1 Tax=Ascobolus immersus RN42 TaxID=1160509 RepID=A0A3N4HLX8_ASCIM|nr:hypothetical protein BJ508DRAFT_314358 [Ascobolus immersus RN42]